MSTNIQLINKIPTNADQAILIFDGNTSPLKGKIDKDWILATDSFLEKGGSVFQVRTLTQHFFIINIKNNENKYELQEDVRLAGAKLLASLRELKLESLIVNDLTNESMGTFFVEGLALANYQFLKYFTDADKKRTSLHTINVLSDASKVYERLSITIEATCKARDLVNEPLSYLTAPQLSKEIESLGKDCGFKVKVLKRKEIESLGMGGVLAVNRGSEMPPRFNILEWKSPKQKNDKPIVLVGKGVVYDTGGLSLKPTPRSMDFMKCDMGGAATVVGIMMAVAKAKLPIHIIGLIPSTDNRPGKDAYVPGDVVTMYSGKTVEVLNTDAEGRMLLADALHFAKQYKPELVLDFATLTGAAARAIGEDGITYMGNADDTTKADMTASGMKVYERLVEFPMWREYNEQLKSYIADIKNLGGPSAGMITAGKFLEHFVDYPWLHFDIAGAAYLHAPKGYRTVEGTGVGVRLIFDFLQNNYN